MGSAAALRAAPSVISPPWAGEPLPLPLPLLPAGGDRTKSRDVAERAGEARESPPAVCGAGSGCPPGCGTRPWGPLAVPGAAERPAGSGKGLPRPSRSTECWALGPWEDKVGSRGSGALSSPLRR